MKDSDVKVAGFVVLNSSNNISTSWCVKFVNQRSACRSILGSPLPRTVLAMMTLGFLRQKASDGKPLPYQKKICPSIRFQFQPKAPNFVPIGSSGTNSSVACLPEIRFDLWLLQDCRVCVQMPAKWIPKLTLRLTLHRQERQKPCFFSAGFYIVRYTDSNSKQMPKRPGMKLNTRIVRLGCQ